MFATFSKLLLHTKSTGICILLVLVTCNLADFSKISFGYQIVLGILCKNNLALLIVLIFLSFPCLIYYPRSLIQYLIVWCWFWNEEVTIQFLFCLQLLKKLQIADEFWVFFLYILRYFLFFKMFIFWINILILRYPYIFGINLICPENTIF